MAVSRVIEVSFGRSSVALVRVDTAYFYNNGIIFKPTDLDLPASYQVHWADSPQASSTLETIGTAEGAPIPDDLWNRSRVIYGWIYLHPTNDSGVTGYEVRIYKNVRAGLPDGTEPTPAEQSTIDQLIGALNSAVEQTGEDVESAEQAKDDAITARDNAQTYANNAQSSAEASARSAESASQSAQTASEKATASAQSASQSAQIKADVEGMVDDAQSYANASAQSATASANFASDSQGYASNAQLSATQASNSASSAILSASDALTYANTASAKAQDASTSAQTASTKATEASQSASQASEYAQTAEQAKTASQTAQTGAEQARNEASQIKTDVQNIADGIDTRLVDVEDALSEKAPVITDTASGAIASFSDGADDLPLKSLVVDINPVQDLSHGDPSPENICPISGWTQVNVNHSDADMTNPTTITINLGQTVYGGKLDVVSGVLTVDRAMVDLGTLSWVYDPTTHPDWSYFYTKDFNDKADEWDNGICNQYKRTASQYARNDDYVFNCTGYRGVSAVSLNIRDSRYTDATAFKAAMSGVQFVYKLATPITIQLTPNQLNSLYGVNNLWADSGDTEAVYRADTKLFIERLTAPDSADMVADANITSGKYFMVGNNLFKATANIANGSAIIVGTNCIRKSLSEALNEINA